MTSPNPFSSASRAANRAVKQSALQTAVVDKQLDEGVRLRMKNGTTQRAAVLTNTLPSKDEDVLVASDEGGSPIVIGTLGTTDSSDDEDGGGSSSDTNRIFLHPDSEYVTVEAPWDGNNGFTFVKGPEHETIPEGYYRQNVGTTAYFSGYNWVGTGYVDGGVIFDLSSIDAPAAQMNGSPQSTITYRIVDHETGEVLVEHSSGQNVGGETFELASTSGVFRIEPLDAEQLQYFSVASAEPLPSEHADWQRPYANLPNFTSSHGSGESWENEVNGGSKSRHSNVSSVTSNCAERYTFYSGTSGVAVMDDGYVYVGSSGNTLCRFDREDKSIDWLTTDVNNFNYLIVEDDIYLVDQNGGTTEFHTHNISDGARLSSASIYFQDETPASNLSDLMDAYVHNGDFIVVMEGNGTGNSHWAYRVQPNGTMVWSTNLGYTNRNQDYLFGSCLVDGYLFTQNDWSDSNEHLFKAIDLTDGSIDYDQWYNDIHTTNNSPQPVSDGTYVYTHVESDNDGGSLVKIDPSTGSESFNFGVGYPSGEKGSMTLAVDNDHLYCSTANATAVEAYSTSDLSHQWTASISDFVGDMVVGSDTLFVRDQSEGLLGLSTTDGSSTVIDSRELAPVALFENELYTTGNNSVTKFIELA